RVRNVVWNASSASCGSLTRCLQTPSTIGPCRATRAAKAISLSELPCLVNRSRSCPSDRPVTVPEPKSTLKGRRSRPVRPTLILATLLSHLLAIFPVDPDPIQPRGVFLDSQSPAVTPAGSSRTSLERTAAAASDLPKAAPTDSCRPAQESSF